MDPLYTCIVHSPADVIAKSRRRAALGFRLCYYSSQLSNNVTTADNVTRLASLI